VARTRLYREGRLALEDFPVDASKELAKYGVSFLLWGLLDDIVDGHFEAVQSLDSEIEALEDLLFDDAPRNTEVQRRSFEFRKSLILLRRVVLPMREVVNSLMRRDLHVLDEGMACFRRRSSSCCWRSQSRARGARRRRVRRRCAGCGSARRAAARHTLKTPCSPERPVSRSSLASAPLRPVR
jgi:hypothetical protein